MRQALTLDDLGLALRPGPGWVTVESRELVLRPAVARAVEAAATAAGAPAVAPILTYLANSLAVGEREIPYSTVTALAMPVAPAFGALTAVGGGSVPVPGDDEILLDAWAAEDLGAAAGDRLTLTYYVVGRDDRLETATAELRVAGVVEMAGLAADPTLTPELPGIADAERIAAWKPPFPIDLGLIRPRDEAYWDRYRATPKAFVSLATGQRLWGSRFGDLTGLRIALPAGADPAAFERAFAERLLAGLPLPALGLAFQPVKARGLAAAAGATDFSGLFIGFSLFLIVAAALLVGLLFSLAVEQRAGEIGLRLAVGYPLKRVRRQLLAEGAAIAAIGALAGTGLAVAYAGLVLRALGSWWRPLVATPFLGLAVEPASLALGFALSVLLVLGAILATLRRLRRVPAVALLRGETVVPETAVPLRGKRATRQAAVVPPGGMAGAEFLPGRRAARSGPQAARPGRWAARIAWGGLAVAVALLGAALFAGGESSAGLFFGVGAALLTAGFAAFARWCRRSGGGLARLAGGGPFALLAGMAARNSARNPGRSLLSVVLVGCAVFVLVSVAANRREAGGAALDRDSGAGGFALVAQSDVPIRQPLDRPEGLAELGLSPEAIAELAGARVVFAAAPLRRGRQLPQPLPADPAAGARRAGGVHRAGRFPVQGGGGGGEWSRSRFGGRARCAALSRREARTHPVGRGVQPSWSRHAAGQLCPSDRRAAQPLDSPRREPQARRDPGDRRRELGALDPPPRPRRRAGDDRRPWRAGAAADRRPPRPQPLPERAADLRGRLPPPLPRPRRLPLLPDRDAG